jgi:hypothetical protein
LLKKDFPNLPNIEMHLHKKTLTTFICFTL